MAASLGISFLLMGSCAREALKIRAEHGKLKNLHCQKSLLGDDR
jgi:hypothetical protein